MEKGSKEIRHGRWLARRMDESKSLCFGVCIEIERNIEARDKSDQYVATILPLEEGTVIAVGSTADEAEQAAVRLFCNMVDHCLETDRLAEFLGDSQIMQEVNQPLDELIDSIQRLREQLRHLHAKAGTGDHSDLSADVPPAWLLGQQSEALCA